MAAINEHDGGGGEAAVRAAPAGGGAGCQWLMVAASGAGLASGDGWPPPDPARDWGRLPRIATRTLGMGAGSIRAARDFTLGILHRWGATERSDDITIVMSELLANALRHARPAPGDPRRAIRLGLLQPGPCVLCAVADAGTAAPVPQPASSLAETGRGLLIVCALSDTWGYTTLSDTGKVVWATFASPLARPRSASRPGTPAQLVPATRR